jgi:hypothetical protein
MTPPLVSWSLAGMLSMVDVYILRFLIWAPVTALAGATLAMLFHAVANRTPKK